MIYAFNDHVPVFASKPFVAPNAAVIGQVRAGVSCSVWYSATIRADNEPITLGDYVNVQEGAVLHVDIGQPLTLANYVTVGHLAMLHGCTIGEGSLIGIGAIVLNGAVIGKGCLIGAGALVPEGKIIPDGSLAIGSPAKVVRQLSAEEQLGLHGSALHYAEKSAQFCAALRPVGDGFGGT